MSSPLTASITVLGTNQSIPFHLHPGCGCGAPLWCLSRHQESPDKLQEVVNLLRSSSNSQVRRVGESFICWVPNGLVVFLCSVLSQREIWKNEGVAKKGAEYLWDQLQFVSVSNHQCVYNICNVYNVICVFIYTYIYTYTTDGFQITHSSLWFTTVQMSFQKLRIKRSENSNVAIPWRAIALKYS